MPELEGDEVFEWDDTDWDEFGFHDFDAMPGTEEPKTQPWEFPSWRPILIWILQMVFHTTSRDGEITIDLNPVGAPGSRQLQVNDPRGLTPSMRRLVEGITVDSGAGASVAHGAQLFPEWELEASSGSKRGLCYIGAGGERMPNEGQRSGKLLFEGGIVGKSRYQE